MIIKCPECDSSFLVPAESLAPKGRKVRCSNCHTEWFQKYKEDDTDAAEDTGAQDGEGMDSGVDADPEYEAEKQDTESNISEKDQDSEAQSQEDDLSIEDINPEGEDFKERDDDKDIPEGVKPEDNLEEGLEIPESGIFGKHTARAVNYACAGAVTILIFLIFTFSGGIIVPKWQDSVMFYRAVGFEYPLPGEDLVFDRVTARVEKQDNGRLSLNVTGKIINPTSGVRYIPDLEYAVLKSDDTPSIAEWASEPPAGQIEKEASLDFSSVFEGEVSPGAKFLKVGFQVKGPE